MSTPACINRCSILGDELVGPTVATTLVFLFVCIM
jgi:hypothetical protein